MKITLSMTTAEEETWVSIVTENPKSALAFIKASDTPGSQISMQVSATDVEAFKILDGILNHYLNEKEHVSES